MVTVSPALQVIRVPGEAGPVLRCFGALDCHGAEVLRRELDLLEPLDHPALTLNLSGCDLVDTQAISTILYSSRRLHARGTHLMAVVRPGRAARILERWGVHRIVPVFSTEEAAALAFRGGPSPAAPPTWGAALAETIVRWYEIGQALDRGATREALRLLTAMTPLCDRSEELFRAGSMPARTRCEFCPLFYERGGQPEDVGCQAMLEPIIAAIQVGDVEKAIAQVAGVSQALEELLILEESGFPDLR
jgi:anti-anti-sigma regulatory factor